MNLIQALRRAVIDRTTTSRASYDKAFDVSNVAFHHSSFPYPIFPMKMGSELSKLLESHPMLPFQGAGGLLSLTQQAFQDYGVNSEDFGKGAAKAKGSRSKSSGKASSSKAGKGSKDAKGRARTPKGKSSGKGSWKDRDHDSRNDWWNHDNDDNEDWGSGWKHQDSRSWGSSKPSNQYSNKGSQNRTRSPAQKGKNNKGSKDSGKKGGKQKPSVVQQVQICLACTCALGYNFSCADCSKSHVPPGFTKQGRMPVKAYICPATTTAGHICGQLLGTAEDCPLCAESRRYWPSEQVQEGWTSLPIFRKCELLQLDRILYEMEIIDPALSTTSHFMDSMNTITAGTDMENFTPQQWAAAWVARIMQPEIKLLLPLPRHTKLPWTVPNWCYGPLEDPTLQQTFYIVSWFIDFLRSNWRTSGAHLAKQYELEIRTGQPPLM